MKSRFKSLQQKLADNTSSDFQEKKSGYLEEIKALSKMIAEEEAKLQMKKNQIKRFKILQNGAFSQKLKLQKQAVKILESTNKEKNTALKKFYWTYEYLKPQLSQLLSRLPEEIKDSDFKIIVDEELIDSVIQQLLKNDREVKG